MLTDIGITEAQFVGQNDLANVLVVAVARDGVRAKAI